LRIGKESYRSIWWNDKVQAVEIIDQRYLPYEFKIAKLQSLEDFEKAIRDMWVRGAPLIGVTAAYGMACAATIDPSDEHMEQAWLRLNSTRPTAINLRWALDLCKSEILTRPQQHRSNVALQLANRLAEEDVETNRLLGKHGLSIIKAIASTKRAGEPVRILTHCNAGWLATVDYGTATSPIYQAHDAGISVHVFVDETRPRNQGALTAWELLNHGVPHDYIVDNAGGHLMQCGEIDLVITGTDRTTANGDVCNKIGTYLKALAAKDNDIPFYVALPSSTIDWRLDTGASIPIEERAADEVHYVQGMTGNGELDTVKVTPKTTKCRNPAFDVTPNRLITGLITERGVCQATAQSLKTLFSDRED
jgi:methylthioribose-1-phosphate isomerase